jgi:hypothetical protein
MEVPSLADITGQVLAALPEGQAECFNEVRDANYCGVRLTAKVQALQTVRQGRKTCTDLLEALKENLHRSGIAGQCVVETPADHSRVELLIPNLSLAVFVVRQALSQTQRAAFQLTMHNRAGTTYHATPAAIRAMELRQDQFAGQVQLRLQSVSGIHRVEETDEGGGVELFIGPQVLPPKEPYQIH